MLVGARLRDGGRHSNAPNSASKKRRGRNDAQNPVFDKNNGQVADLINKWLTDKGLAD
jgi:hypothetical protein